MEPSFEEILIGNDVEKLNDLKHWLFEENIRLAIREKELENMQKKFQEERVNFVEEMKGINLKVVRERQRLKDEETFFDKKMDILKNGFEQLEIDRKKLQRERMEFEAERKVARDVEDTNAFKTITGSLFAGVNNPLALKKRYRDLLKIFHPDNLCGDTEMVAYINKEYERLKDEIDYSYKNAN